MQSPLLSCFFCCSLHSLSPTFSLCHFNLLFSCFLLPCLSLFLCWSLGTGGNKRKKEWFFFPSFQRSRWTVSARRAHEQLWHCGTPNSPCPPLGRERGNGVVLQRIPLLYSASFSDLSTTASVYLTSASEIVLLHPELNISIRAKPKQNSPGFLGAVWMCKFFADFSAVTGGVGMCGSVALCLLNYQRWLWFGVVSGGLFGSLLDCVV